MSSKIDLWQISSQSIGFWYAFGRIRRRLTISRKVETISPSFTSRHIHWRASKKATSQKRFLQSRTKTRTYSPTGIGFDLASSPQRNFSLSKDFIRDGFPELGDWAQDSRHCNQSRLLLEGTGAGNFPLPPHLPTSLYLPSSSQFFHLYLLLTQCQLTSWHIHLLDQENYSGPWVLMEPRKYIRSVVVYEFPHS